MAEIPPIKDPGAIKDFAAADVALVGGLRRLVGDMTFQDPNANGGAVITLTQLLAGLGPAAWTSLTDTPGAIVADNLVIADAAGLALAFRGPTFQNIRGTEAAVTGVVAPGDLELSVFSITQIEVAAGDIGIAIRTTSNNVKEFSSNAGSAAQITPAGLANRQSFWTASDVGQTGTIVIKEYATHPTVANLRTEALLGISLHSGSNVIGVVNMPDVWRDQGQAVNDKWRPTGVEGLPVQSGTGLASEVPATLTINTTDMVLEAKGVGFHSSSGVDPNHSDPITGQTPFTFRTIKPDGVVFNSGVTVFPKTWNNAGTETVLTGKKAVVHQVAWLIDGEGIVQLGTTDYADFDTAVAAIQQERISNVLWDVARQFGATIGVVVISNSAGTAWADGLAHLIPMANGQVNIGGPTSWLSLVDTPSAFLTGRVSVVNTPATAILMGKVRSQVNFNFAGNVAPANDISFRFQVTAFFTHIDGVRLMVKTTEGTTALVVDVNKNAVTLFGAGKPTLGLGVAESNTVPTVTFMEKGDDITIDIDSGGTEWQDLTVAIQGWSEPE